MSDEHVYYFFFLQCLPRGTKGEVNLKCQTLKCHQYKCDFKAQYPVTELVLSEH